MLNQGFLASRFLAPSLTSKSNLRSLGVDSTFFFMTQLGVVTFLYEIVVIEFPKDHLYMFYSLEFLYCLRSFQEYVSLYFC